jgi:hypothetical protein
MMPPVVLQDDDLSRQDAADKTSLVSYCYKKQHNTTEVWSGNDATKMIKMVVTLQVVLQDGNSVGNDAATKISLVSYCFLSSIISQE